MELNMQGSKLVISSDDRKGLSMRTGFGAEIKIRGEVEVDLSTATAFIEDTTPTNQRRVLVGKPLVGGPNITSDDLKIGDSGDNLI